MNYKQLRLLEIFVDGRSHWEKLRKKIPFETYFQPSNDETYPVLGSEWMVGRNVPDVPKGEIIITVMIEKGGFKVEANFFATGTGDDIRKLLKKNRLGTKHLETWDEVVHQFIATEDIVRKYFQTK